MLLNCGVEKTLESPLDCKEIQPAHPEGDQSWIFIGRTDAEGETPILWPPEAKNWLIGKDPDAGKDWRREEKRMTEDEMNEWHHRLNGNEWVNSGSWWWTERLGVLQSMGSQRVRYNWVTELDWTKYSQTEEILIYSLYFFFYCLAIKVSVPALSTPTQSKVSLPHFTLCVNSKHCWCTSTYSL